ncbi:uncharacterized protein si:ch211-140l13.3 isoform X2 [Perca flavescens]|uniref:uncharacterized protein si:ch211-140l13.3 isoform X2 n=2 Tax=Perca flavescens TaxID=8167 RepID=UPI00106EB2C9|nr:uncharacterized protein LOC114573268 isoform X2 [Perca flavescens]
MKTSLVQSGCQNKPSEYRATMSAEIPMERTYQRTCTDSNRSVQTPAPIPATSGTSGVEHQGDSLGPLAFQCEPMVGKTHPDLSSLLSPADAIPVGPYQPTAANLDAFQAVNQTRQQVPHHPYEVLQQQIEQIHQVLQEQSRLLTLLGTVSVEGLMFPACVPLRWIGLPPVLTAMSSDKLPVFNVSSPPPPSDGRRPEDHPVSTCLSQDAFRSKKETAEQRDLPATTGTDHHRDEPDQDPVSPSGVRNIPPANSEDRSAVREEETFGECVEVQLKLHEISEPKQLQTLSGKMRLTERHYFLREGEGISKVDRNHLKFSDQQDVLRGASLGPQQPSRKLTLGTQRRSPAPSPVFKDVRTQLENFLETFKPEHSLDFGTLQDFCSASYNPQTAEYSQRKTQTEIQAQAHVRGLEQAYFNTPLVSQPETLPHQVKQITNIPATTEREEKVGQLQERNSKVSGKKDCENSHSRETESRMNDSLSEPTPSDSKSFREKRVRRQDVAKMGETAGKVDDEDEVKGQFAVTAPRRKMTVISSVATSEDLWEKPLQQNNTPVRTPKHPRVGCESNSVQHVNISPPLKDNRVPPRAWGNQEVIVSVETIRDHMERVPSFNIETLSTGCDGTKTRFHLRQWSMSRPGSSKGSNGDKGQKQAATTAAAAFCLCAANDTSEGPTPLKRNTLPTHSASERATGGGSGSGSDDEYYPPSQCHQFPKLPSPPPCLGLHDSHLNLSEDDNAGEADERWTFPGIQKREQSLGSGLRPQHHSSSSGSNKDDKAWADSNGGQKMSKVHSLKPEKSPDGPDVTDMAQTSRGFLRERVDETDELKRGCKGNYILSDRTEVPQDMRNPHSLHKLETRAVQALRQQMEALQQQFKQRDSDWSVVRRQLQEVITETSELRKNLTVTPHCHPVAVQRTAQTQTVHQEGPTEMEQLLSNGCSLVTFTDGTRKVTSADQKTKTVTFFNGDIKHILEDGKVHLCMACCRCITMLVHRQRTPPTQMAWRSFTSTTSRLRSDTLGGGERSYFQTRPSSIWRLTAARGQSSPMAPSFTSHRKTEVTALFQGYPQGVCRVTKSVEARRTSCHCSGQ